MRSRRSTAKPSEFSARSVPPSRISSEAALSVRTISDIVYDMGVAAQKVQDTTRAFQVRYFLVFWLFILSTVAFLDRTNISIAGVAMGQEYGLSKVQLGWVFSAFLIGYA